jgi:hypothetical protein
MLNRIIDFLKLRMFAYPLITLMALPRARHYITHSEWSSAARFISGEIDLAEFVNRAR